MIQVDHVCNKDKVQDCGMYQFKPSTKQHTTVMALQLIVDLKG